MAQARYQSAAPPDQLALFGFTSADLDDTVEVYPDLWPVFELFEALSTQWRTGMCGPTGLDYGVIRDVAAMIGMKKKQINEVFFDLQVMEAEALAVMAESK